MTPNKDNPAIQEDTHDQRVDSIFNLFCKKADDNFATSIAKIRKYDNQIEKDSIYNEWSNNNYHLADELTATLRNENCSERDVMSTINSFWLYINPYITKIFEDEYKFDSLLSDCKIKIQDKYQPYFQKIGSSSNINEIDSLIAEYNSPIDEIANDLYEEILQKGGTKDFAISMQNKLWQDVSYYTERIQESYNWKKTKLNESNK